MKNVKRQEVPTDINCEKCGHTMVIKWGKLGSFLACSNYPECKNTQDFKKDDQGKIVIVPKEFTDKKCEKCAEARWSSKSGKFGKFLACSDYPNCKYTAAITLGIHCPECKEGEICQKQSRYRRVFYSCNKWPNCTFACWDKPLGHALPAMQVTRSSPRKSPSAPGSCTSASRRNAATSTSSTRTPARRRRRRKG